MTDTRFRLIIKQSQAAEWLEHAMMHTDDMAMSIRDHWAIHDIFYDALTEVNRETGRRYANQAM